MWPRYQQNNADTTQHTLIVSLDCRLQDASVQKKPIFYWKWRQISKGVWPILAAITYIVDVWESYCTAEKSRRLSVIKRFRKQPGWTNPKDLLRQRFDNKLLSLRSANSLLKLNNLKVYTKPLPNSVFGIKMRQTAGFKENDCSLAPGKRSASRHQSAAGRDFIFL